MSIEYYKDKYIQSLQDKIMLQEKINGLNGQVNDLKAQLLNQNENPQSRKRRVVRQEVEESVSSVSDSSGSEFDENPSDMIPLKNVIDDRHSGTVGMLTKKDKELLTAITAQFLKKYNLQNAPNAIPRGYINKYNSYLDRKIDQGLFNSPKIKRKKRVFKVVYNLDLILG